MQNVNSVIGKFLWDGFTDPEGVGVSLRDVLDGAALAGVVLTEREKDSVIRHMDDIDSWTAGDEAVRDKIADATDSANYVQLRAWLAFVVGDDAADAMIREWGD